MNGAGSRLPRASLGRTRRRARRLALDVLYEAEIRDLLPVEAFAERRSNGWVGASDDDPAGREVVDEAGGNDSLDYARALVEGVQEHQADIDEIIVTHADRWALKRMPVVDRNVLRIGLFELLRVEGMPVAVAINEAVELVKTLSTEDSGRFINGLLGRVAEDRGLA